MDFAIARGNEEKIYKEVETLAGQLCERLFRQIDGEHSTDVHETAVPVRCFFRESCGCREIPPQ